MGEEIFFNQGVVTVKVHNQLINAFRNSKSKKYIRNHILIHATLVISVMNVMVRKKYVFQMYIGGLFHCKFPKTRNFR